MQDSHHALTSFIGVGVSLVDNVVNLFTIVPYVMTVSHEV